MRTNEKIRAFYDALLAAYGPQGWWPAETPLEMVVGAILTQNTSWTNVERAIANLKAEGLLDVAALHAAGPVRLAEAIKPAGYFNVKSRRLKNFMAMLVRDFGGDLDALFALSAGSLRETILEVSGVGPETADSIVLYGARKLTFVVDAYTARILHRHGVIDMEATYEDIQSLMRGALADDLEVFQEYHALLVAVGKGPCKKRAPECPGCPLQPFLEEGQPAGER
jgi:endonuclease III related protein